MNKAQGLNAQVVDCDELLLHSSVDPFTKEVTTRGGTLLVPDEEGYPRRYRRVYILAGTTSCSFGGSEEGGWYYDHFNEAFRLEVSVDSEEALVTVLGKVDELLTLVQGVSYTQIRIGVEDYPYFQRPHYE